MATTSLSGYAKTPPAQPDGDGITRCLRPGISWNIPHQNQTKSGQFCPIPRKRPQTPLPCNPTTPAPHPQNRTKSGQFLSDSREDRINRLARSPFPIFIPKIGQKQAIFVRFRGSYHRMPKPRSPVPPTSSPGPLTDPRHRHRHESQCASTHVNGMWFP